MNVTNTTPPAPPMLPAKPVAVSSAAAVSATGTTVPASAAKPSQQVDYMKLIVAQMRNLNPMDPNSGGDSLPTMMQAESLNQLTALNKSLQDLQTMTQTSYASGLMGRTVSGVDEANNPVTGQVRGLRITGSGPLLELTTGVHVRLLDITDVSAAQG